MLFGISTISHGKTTNRFENLTFRGDTRRVEGERKGKSHGEDSGEFDSSQIVMKRWVEFELARRPEHSANQQLEMACSIPRPPSSKAPSSVRDANDV